MAELRTDRILDRWVLIAEARGGRPNDFVRSRQGTDLQSTLPGNSSACPFCPGNEILTPAAVDEQFDDQGRWQVRVVPNKFPAVSIEPPTSAIGVHEVVIESRRHVQYLGQLSVAETALVLETYRRRLRQLRSDGRLGYGLVFKNTGFRAGASLVHLHSQIIALANVPPLVHRELQQLDQHAKVSACCHFCTQVGDLRARDERLVLDGDGYVAFCPYASLQPYETWIMPVDHRPSFEDDAGPSATDPSLANLVHAVVRRIERAVPGAGYNAILRTAPWGHALAGRFHWRMEIRPRLASLAGLELATGVHINHVPPERAARELKNSDLSG